jgi:hypothetical protein
MLDVCICTHDPRRDVFAVVLEAIARQTAPKSSFRVCVVDNASDPAVSKADLLPLDRAGVAWQLLHEPRLGNSYARECAIRTTDGELVTFVDDDNEIADDYLERALEIAAAHSEIGCFGGKLLNAIPGPVPKWAVRFLPFLGIMDKGEEVLKRCTDHWGPWEPPTAGATVRRPVLDLYLRRMAASRLGGSLGRKGRSGLLSCEDSLMMRGAYELGLECSYQPRLRLRHHVDRSRLRFRYLLRLMHGYGRSHVILERALGRQVPTISLATAIRSVGRSLYARFPSGSLRSYLCYLAYDFGTVRETRRTGAAVAG